MVLRFSSGKGLPLKKLAELYTNKRTPEVIETYKYYFDKLSDSDRKCEEQCLFSMFTKLPLRINQNPIFDRKLIKMDSQRYLKPLTSIFHYGLRAFFNRIQIMDQFFTFAFNTKDLNKSIKGGLVQCYILNVLESINNINLDLKYVTEKINMNFCLNNYETVHFFVDLVPPIMNFKKKLFFIPDSPNYPQIDFLFWNCEIKILYVFQITIQTPFTDHSNSVWDKSNYLYIEWKNLLDFTTSHKIWITNNEPQDKNLPLFKGQLYWNFTSDNHIFPNLHHLN